MRAIPTVDDFESDVVTQCFDDMVNPPGLTNFLGAAQVDHDITGVRSVNVPPYSQGDTITGVLSLDGRLFRSFGVPVSLRWRPDQVSRWAQVGELTVATTTVMPRDTAGVVVDIAVTNTSERTRQVRLGLSVASTVTRAAHGWREPSPPAEPNDVAPVPGRPAVIGRARTSAAVAVQGVDVAEARVREIAKTRENYQFMSSPFTTASDREFQYVVNLNEIRPEEAGQYVFSPFQSQRRAS